MFKRIMVPVDLAHLETLEKALQAAADLALHHDATVVYVGVTAATPGSVAHNPAEYAETLVAFARTEAETRGIQTESLAITSHDPTTDLDPTLLKAVDETGSDLVVMASHVPTIKDYIWPSNGGTVAGHAKVSVLVIR